MYFGTWLGQAGNLVLVPHLSHDRVAVWTLLHHNPSPGMTRNRCEGRPAVAGLRVTFFGYCSVNKALDGGSGLALDRPPVSVPHSYLRTPPFRRAHALLVEDSRPDGK